MTETQWSRANRAATALDSWMMEAHPESTGYGDEGSEDFDAAVLGLLVDLKHLLWRVDPTYELSQLAEKAVDIWSDESETLPEGGDEDD